MPPVISKVFFDIRTLEARCRSVSLKNLELALKNLTSVVEERRKSESARTEKISKFLKQLENDGIDPSEIISDLCDSADLVIKRRRSKRPAKFRYTLTSGEVKTWTGQGRTPLPIQQYIDNGGSIDDFLIKD